MTYVLKNETGLHARPASLLVAESKKYKSAINLIKNGQSYNAKSIISVMAMEAKCGDTIEISCQGEDAEEATANIIKVLESL